jgi:hypothetical protein
MEVDSRAARSNCVLLLGLDDCFTSIRDVQSLATTSAQDSAEERAGFFPVGMTMMGSPRASAFPAAMSSASRAGQGDRDRTTPLIWIGGNPDPVVADQVGRVAAILRPQLAPDVGLRPLIAWRKRPITIRGPVATLQSDRDPAVRALPSKPPTISTICSRLPLCAGNGPVVRRRRVERPRSPMHRIPRCL